MSSSQATDWIQINLSSRHFSDVTNGIQNPNWRPSRHELYWTDATRMSDLCYLGRKTRTTFSFCSSLPYFEHNHQYLHLSFHVLNALVMITVKSRRRLRAHKSNIAIALLATTDFVAGGLAQPVFIAWLISILVNYRSELCSFRILSFLINILYGVSILHLLLISGERFLAIKHPFSHISLVKESNLLIASALAWLLPSVVNVYFFLTENMIAFVLVDNSVILTSVACIGYCHFKVYFEIRRHKRQIADQQVAQETRKKVFKRSKGL